MSDKYQTPEPNEAGVVSIIVATLLIIILSLLVLAFAQVSRREQRESLDSQLSTQAFYAAETGINDAKQAISSNLTAVTPKLTCPPTASGYNFNNQLDGSDVGYTCVLIDPTPTVLSTTVGYQPSVTHLQSADGSNIANITISWARDKSSSSTANCPASTTENPGGTMKFPTTDAWDCPYGVIRADLVATNNLSREGLLSNLITGFLIPQSTSPGGGKNLNPGDKVVVGAANCDTRCSVNLVLPNTSEYYLRLSSIYKKIDDVRITGNNGSVHFKNAMVKIDVTGRAQDVLRRVVVSVPLTESGVVPKAALQSGDSVCKRFGVADGVFSLDSPLTTDTSNPLCSNTGP